MKALIDYLEARGEKPFAFAERAGISLRSAYQLVNGATTSPGASILKAIHEATGLSYEDMINSLPPGGRSGKRKEGGAGKQWPIGGRANE